MSVNLSLFAGAGWQFFTDNGIPLSGGLLYTYTAGSTSPETTYIDNGGVTQNANPIVLDAAGRPPSEIWLSANTSYKFVVKTSTGTLIRTYDDIPGANDSTTIDNFIVALANTSNIAQGDALVGFKQANANGILTGAVGKTVHDKLTEFVSVKDFGAVGNGVADDTTAIQAAIDAALANNIGVVSVPSGTYNITAPIRIYTDVSIIGEGSGSSVISKSTNTLGTGTALARSGTITDSYVYDDIIQLIHTDNAYTYNVTIKGLRLTKAGYTASSHGIYYPRAAYLTIEDVHILNVEYGTFTYDTFVSSIKNTQVQAVAYGFTYANDGSGLNSGTTALFQNCAVNFDVTVAQPNIGFNLNLLTYSNLISCGVDNGNRTDGSGITAYFIGSSNTISVSGCGCENSRGRMIYLGSGSATFTGLRTIGINGSTVPTIATVSCETGSTLTLINCKFEPLLSAGVQFNWQIQTGGQVLEVNPQESPTGGAGFISYTGGGAKTTITPTGSTQSTSNGTYTYQAYPILAAAPTTGTWAVGNIVYNSVPASAGYIGWVCTSASDTTTGTINSASNSLAVANGAGIVNGDTITIAGAGVAGASLTTTVSSGGGTATLILGTTASTSVVSAAVTTPGTWKTFGVIS